MAASRFRMLDSNCFLLSAQSPEFTGLWKHRQPLKNCLTFPCPTLFSNARLTSHGVYSYPQVSLGKPHSDCHRALCPALTIALVSALFTPSSSQASGRCGLPSKCRCSVLPKHFKTGRVGSEQECVSHPKGHDSEKRVCVPQLSALEDDIKQAMQNTRPWGLNQAYWEPEIAAYQ